MKKATFVLILILILASFLRLYGLSRGDTVSDEVFYGFRAIGLIDFVGAPTQTTPFEWYDPQIPWWVHLSYSDHPPLVFLIQHFSIKIFGDNNFGLRFPSALFGILSVYILYLLGKRLFSSDTGLIASLFLAITLNHVYVSRLGLQESFVIFFILLASHFFLKALEKDKYFVWLGIVFGFGVLAKYNIFILAPIFISYLAFFRRDCFLKKRLWIGAFLALLIFSPVIIYNLELYKNAGHFDFQFSYIFKQYPKEWQSAPGKEIGTLGDRFKNFVPRLVASNSWLFLFLTAFSFLAFFAGLFKNWRGALKKYSFLIIAIVFMFLLIMLTGPSYRFLTMITPFFVLAAAAFLVFIHQKVPKAGLIIIAFLAAFEIFYSINNEISYYPKGPGPWLFSKVRYENYNWGYNELDDYLSKEFKGKLPMLTFDVRYKFLDKLRGEALAKESEEGFEPLPFLIVYGGNFDDGAKLWVMERRLVYYAWPILRIADYYKYLQERGPDYFDKAGFKNQYFIWQTNEIENRAFRDIIKGISPTHIKNQRGDIVFEVYKKISN